jgi:adenylate cyclase
MRPWERFQSAQGGGEKAVRQEFKVVPREIERECAEAACLPEVRRSALIWGVARGWLKRWRVHLGIVVLMVVPALLLALPGARTSFWLLAYARLKFESLENSTVDYRVTYYRRAAVDPSLVFLAIDSTSVLMDATDPATIASSPPLASMARGFPYPRDFYAAVCDRLFGAEAKAVALDVDFQNPRPGDDVFRAALEKYRGRFVLGMNFSDDLQHGSPSLSLPPASLLPSQDPSDRLLGFLNFWPDSDGVVRHAQYRTNLEAQDQQPDALKFPAFDSLAARAIGDAGFGPRIPPSLEPRAIRFASLLKFPTYSLYQIFEPHIWAATFQNGAYFHGKIVLVGPKGDWAKDQLATPIGQINGAEIHLNAMNALLEDDFLTFASDRVVMATIVLAGAVAFLLSLIFTQIAWRFAVALIVLATYAGAIIAAYDGPGWLLPVLAPVGVFGGATGLGFIYDFVLNQVEKFQLRATFERYTSKNVAKYLLDHSSSYREMLAGMRRPVTILFSDVRNFTAMSEEAAAQGRTQHHVVKLNEYLTAMVDCVFREDGSLDKFIGDAVMAVWGNTPYNFGPQGDAVRAVHSARAMLEEMRRLNAKWLAEGDTAWRIGIGLNHGDVIVGDMGSPQRKEFAVLGDAVNLASRLEGLTKSYGTDLLLGESVAEMVRDEFHLLSVGIVQVKGKSQAVPVFTVLDEKSAALSPEKRRYLHAYEEGARAFRNRDFGGARELFGQALAAQPGDSLASAYLASCETFLKTPPDSSWSGVHVMTEK